MDGSDLFVPLFVLCSLCCHASISYHYFTTLMVSRGSPQSSTMLRLKKTSNTDLPHLQPQATRSPPASPQAERKASPREPYPVPSSNPASQYTLLEKLGTGSFGTVYKAIHNETKQIVAVKQIGTGNPSPTIFYLTHGKGSYRLGRFR